MLTDKLERPWGITVLPDGRLLITQKEGTMLIVTPQGNVGAPITGLPAVNSEAQGGLLGVTIDPSFSSNRMVYWTFSENISGGTVTSVAKGKLSADDKKMENAMVACTQRLSALWRKDSV
jgi:glucose/arabinose dehydrogenase